MVKILDQDVGQIGYGLMNFTWRTDPVSPENAIKAMKAALDSGSVFWNGGVFYGPVDGYNSNALLREYFTKYPSDASKVLISIKGGVGKSGKVEGTEENLRAGIKQTNDQLGGTKTLDIFEMGRVDPERPIEVPMRAFKKLIDEGQLRGVTLSEAGAGTIRRAAKILPIHGVEVEFSLFETSILRNGVAKACAENNIPVIAYSPLSRGFLTSQWKSLDDLAKDDIRRHLPRFYPENFDSNLKLADQVKAMAQKKGCTVGQVALGWILGQSKRNGNPEIIPIPGATTEDRVRENTKVVKLTEDEMTELNKIVESIDVKGEQYNEHLIDLCFVETPEES